MKLRSVLRSAPRAARAAAPLAAIPLLLAACAGRSEPEPAADLVGYLSGPAADAGFARVTAPRTLRFPEDEGPHHDYQTEWWYYTGNLSETGAGAVGAGGAGGRDFGFQLTFFRRALAPAAGGTPRPSAWSTEQVYLAHFALSDLAAGRFHSAERLARGAAGLSGAIADPFRVWLETWSVARPEARAPVRLRAADGPIALDLDLRPAKPPVAHGEAGYSRKGPEAGDASYYYSYPRLAAAGWVTTTEGAFPVQGLAWMDHEWSTSALAEDQVGWDWFSLQLDDGRELMLFQLRQADGGLAEWSSGSLIDRDGALTRLGREDFALEVRRTWTSPRSGGTYPVRWRLRVPGAGLDLDIEARMDDQEHALDLRYWEGAVRVQGQAEGRPVAGLGYAELTGYAPGAPGEPGG